jgi:uncharacterized protein
MESTVASKLDALLRLQSLDSQLDQILQVRGDLPEEVRDLEDEIAGYQVRVSKFDEEIAELQLTIANRKQGIKDSEKLIKKYEEQQENVRNNREFDAITKEVELQKLEIQINEKKIREANFQIEQKVAEIQDTKNRLEERQKDLNTKNGELQVMVQESEDDERKLNQQKEEAIKQIEDRLIFAYNRIRKNVRNGLAVVAVKRDACGGCFNTVPPQRQSDIASKKKITVCEHCGRILADVEQKIVA